MIDIVTVVFDEELPILSCQAQSLDLYSHDIGIRGIWVMINDKDLANKIDLSWWGALADRVRLIPRETFDVPWGSNGWVNQQLLKMLGSSQSQNTWSMVLDAKTVITRPLARDYLLTHDGRIKLGWMPTLEVFSSAQDIANSVFHSSHHQTLQPAGVPFFFHNQSIRHMIDHVQRITDQDFNQWFLAQGRLTEFVLYSTWMACDADRTALYAGSDQTDPVKVCNVCHSQVDQFTRVIGQHDERTASLSIHRRAWARLPAADKDLFRQKLMACGVTRARDLL